jgi:hypothetical protein
MVVGTTDANGNVALSVGQGADMLTASATGYTLLSEQIQGIQGETVTVNLQKGTSTPTNWTLIAIGLIVIVVIVALVWGK